MKESLYEDLTKKDRFLKGIRKLKNNGVSIFIDNRESSEKEWPVLLREREDTSFYMCDFIEDPDTGKLISVRFDRVTHEAV